MMMHLQDFMIIKLTLRLSFTTPPNVICMYLRMEDINPFRPFEIWEGAHSPLCISVLCNSVTLGR